VGFVVVLPLMQQFELHLEEQNLAHPSMGILSEAIHLCPVSQLAPVNKKHETPSITTELNI